MPLPIFIDDISQLPEVFASVEEDFALIDFQPVMEGELDEIARFERSLFDRQVSPDGAPWAANAPSTIAKKGHDRVLRGLRGQQPPKLEGVRRHQKSARFRLSNSLTLKSRQSVEDAIREAVGDSKGAALSFGTTVEYSVYHDHGSDHFPARQHVGVNEKYLDEATERVADYAIEQLVKG